MAEKTSSVFIRIIYAIAAAMLVGILIAWATGYWVSAAVIGMAAAMLAVGVALAVVWGRFGRELRMRDGYVALIVAAVCFAVKLVAVLRWRAEPLADYATFYRTAADLAETGSISLHRYVALFPHIYGYSAFLSVFYRIFGTGILVAPIVNAGLSALTAALLYLLVRRYSTGRAGIVAAALWVICPSQTLYNIYVLSEPLYTCELVGALLIVDTLRRRLGRFGEHGVAKTAGLAVALGALLGAIQLVRPIGTIVVIALAGILIAVDLPYDLRTAALRVGAIVVAFVVMTAGTKLVGLRIDAALGEPRATSVGYSYAVGLNEESGGRWNADVSAKLMEYSNQPGASAGDAQSKMMDDVKAMIASGEINYLSLFGAKFVNLLEHDHSVVASYGVDVFRHQGIFNAICDAFYIMCVVAALVGAVMAFIKKERGLLIFCALYGLGLVAAQMLVEVAIRYHYSLYLMLIPLAAYGFEAISNRFGVRK